MCLPNPIHKTLCAHPWISTSTQTQTCWQINMLVCYSECLVRLHVFSLINWISIPYFCCFFLWAIVEWLVENQNAKKTLSHANVNVSNGHNRYKCVEQSHFILPSWGRYQMLITVDMNEWIFQQSQPLIYKCHKHISFGLIYSSSLSHMLILHVLQAFFFEIRECRERKSLHK